MQIHILMERNFTRKARNGISTNRSVSYVQKSEKNPNKLSKLSQCVIQQSITFFLNLPVRQLGVMPFIPAITDSINVSAEKLGLNVATAPMFIYRIM